MIERTVEELFAAPAPGEEIDVTGILADVRARGDDALAEYARRFGDPAPRRISADECKRAYDSIDARVRQALQGAAERIETFARAQRDALRDVTLHAGELELGHRAIPLQRVGIYVPSGRHPLPSSLLMGAIPAGVAGVRERVVCTPRAHPIVLAAGYVARVDTLFELGGAQAIAAMAYGTPSVPRVDLIAGPGNAYVTAAKRALFGTCGIDALAGPSEIAIVASSGADPDVIAADLLAQAEHDEDARAVLLTDERILASAVSACIDRRLERLPTAEVVRTSLERRGGCIIVPIEETPAICNRLAPEHLSLQGGRAESLADRFTAYGALFIGSNAGEVLGDYGSGPNHVLPTGGSARFSAGLSVFTFLTLRTYERGGEKGDRRIANDAAILAQAEGLPAHREAALARL
jgi:histidinol dehydrogenase